MIAFEFVTAPEIRFGRGVRDGAPAAIRRFGHRAMVVSGKSTARTGWLPRALAEAGVDVVPCTVPAEPTVELVHAGGAAAREHACDVVVGLGGGSVLDAAKAIAALATNVGDPFDYLEVVGQGRALAASPLPVVAIPTTAGTGSEVTKNAVLTASTHQLKVSLRSPLMLPRVALVDPDLTVDMPPAVTAWTGLDALTQLIEPYLSCRANPMTDALTVDGMRRAAVALPRAWRDGRDLEARTAMAFASLLGGMALANAGLGAVHGFAGTIGGLYGAPHGAICAALLPHVLAGNLEALERRSPGSPARARFDDVARLVTGRPTAVAADGVAWVAALVADLEIPNLSAYGVTTADAGRIASQAARSSSMKGNPIVLSPEELEAILSAAIAGPR